MHVYLDFNELLMDAMKKVMSFLLFIVVCFFNVHLQAQVQGYFVDGYHGGVYGHYPKGYTRFMVNQLQKHPDWKINLEIEPETWDRERTEDPLFYNYFADMIADPFSRIEYVNPTYAQSYLFNTSAESSIRQFVMGLAKLREHFPTISFRTYSSEEPCFTAALPTILNSLGVKYASSKNPNTCWGGYTSAFGNQNFVTWRAADGSSVLCVPRYASEKLESNSTWQTNAWGMSEEYVRDAVRSGISFPVGMCLQDAGWRGGPWLKMSGHHMPVKYTLWSEYFDKYALSCKPEEWNMSQEDIKVSLVWGAQVLQKIAQHTRYAENLLPQTEKIATMAYVWKHTPWESWKLKEAWRGLLLSQHHDCWIVPYNGAKGETWADKVNDWTSSTNRYCSEIIEKSGKALGNDKELISGDGVVIFNTLPYSRKEFITVNNPHDQSVYSLRAEVPAMGYSTYLWKDIIGKKVKDIKGLIVRKKGKYIIETDKYYIEINPKYGGAIESLKAKLLGNKEFVNRSTGYKFNTLRGYFTDLNKFVESSDNPVNVSILMNTPYIAKIRLDGEICGQPYYQTLSVTKDSELINCELHVNWKKNVHIGKRQSGEFRAEDRMKSFYDDRYKLHVVFPSIADGGIVDKNAPLEICRSRETNTFFNSWDNIKHNIILNWVDNVDRKENYGIALFSDHTTSYLQGEDYPLGLTIQYSGVGLWGRDYIISEPTAVRYALIPHCGNWQDADIPLKSMAWNEPLLAVNTDCGAKRSASLLEFSDKGYELMACYVDKENTYIRIANMNQKDKLAELLINGHFLKLNWVELDGRYSEVVCKNNKVKLSIPPFGFKTLCIKGLSAESL